jgi:CheY-like chemotaxis protein
MAHVARNPVKARILVVDDSPEIQRYLRALLELDSYKVETASSGDEALQSLCQGSAPDVVLLDLQMPGMDGLETLRRLKQVQSNLKVIMCSGVDDPAKIREAVLLGAHGYLVKPVQHLYLSAAIERCLKESTANHPTEPMGAQLFVLPSPGPNASNSRDSAAQSLIRTSVSRNSLS